MSFRDNHVRLDTDGRVDEDLICLGCGYNLRSLTLDRACPECGTAVGRSAIGNRLTYANPKWVSRVSLGATLLATFLVLAIFTVVGIVAFFVTDSTFTPGMGVLAGVVTVGLKLLNFTAFWLFTTPEPNVEQDVRSRRVVRLAIAVTVACWALDLVAPVEQWSSLSAILLFNVVAYTLHLVVLFGGFVYAAHLARRIPDEQLANTTRTVMWGLATCYGLVVALRLVVAFTGGTAMDSVGCVSALLGLGMLVFGVWAILLVFRYSSALAYAAASARRSWAADSV